MKAELCAEIRRPIPGSEKYRFSSGYYIGSGLILTCSHGLFHCSVDKNSDIKITWRDRKAASMAPISIPSGNICWVNEALDVALLRCQCPNAAADAFAQNSLSPTPPSSNQPWKAGGFSARLEGVENGRKFLAPSGTISDRFSEQTHINLWCEKGHPEEAELWGGFSGSAVFLAGKIIGVAKASNKGVAGKEITAVSIAALLQAEDDHGRGTFAKVVGWQDPQNRICRQKQQFKPMCDVLNGQDKVVKIMAESLKQQLSLDELSVTDIAAVVQHFNRLSDDQAIECISDIFSIFCQEQQQSQAQVVGQFAEAWLPILFAYDECVDRVKANLGEPDGVVADSPTRLPVPTELMMAEVDGHPFKFDRVANTVVSPFDIGGPVEVGLDEDGKDTRRQFEQFLAARFVRAEKRSEFIESVNAATLDIARPHAHGSLTGKEGEARKKTVSKLLKNLCRMRGRRFYYSFEAADDLNIDSLKQLSKDYPSLAFLLSRCEDEDAEEDRYLYLSQIIAVGKGAPIP